MVPRTHIFAIALMFTGLFTYYYAYNVYMGLLGMDQSLSTVLAKILSFVNPPDSAQEPSIKSGGFYLTEERAVKFWFMVSGLCVASAFILAVIHRRFFGQSRLFVPIAFCAIVVLGGLTKVTYDIGLLNGN